MFQPRAHNPLLANIIKTLLLSSLYLTKAYTTFTLLNFSYWGCQILWVVSHNSQSHRQKPCAYHFRLWNVNMDESGKFNQNSDCIHSWSMGNVGCSLSWRWQGTCLKPGDKISYSFLTPKNRGFHEFNQYLVSVITSYFYGRNGCHKWTNFLCNHVLKHV